MRELLLDQELEVGALGRPCVGRRALVCESVPKSTLKSPSATPSVSHAPSGEHNSHRGRLIPQPGDEHFPTFLSLCFSECVHQKPMQINLQLIMTLKSVFKPIWAGAWRKKITLEEC